MSKSWEQFKKPLAMLLMGLVYLSVPALGQVPVDGRRLLDIQHAFIRGEMSVDEAALEQFRVLYEPTDPHAAKHKCAVPARMFLEAHRGEISPEAMQKIEALRPARLSSGNQKAVQNYLSPSGKFEILYETSGPDSVSVVDDDGNGVPDYVDLVAEAADSSYRHEVLNIGFKDPIPSGSTYQIELKNLTYYGETQTSGSSPQTYITIENDFDGFAPNTHPDGDQAGAVYVTVAHELKHAIQYAQNRWRSPSGAYDWAEMDATLMEEVVYDDVNDYYNYIKNNLNSSQPYTPSIFYAPQNGTPGAYYHVTWMIFYTEFYGNEVWRQVWEDIEADNFLSIDAALKDVLPAWGDTFEESFVRNHLWHLASGTRAGRDDTYGFDEKDFYPYANLESSFTGVPSESFDISYINPLAARYFEVTPTANDNGYIDVAVDFDSTQTGLGLLFYMKDGEMREVIATGEDKSQVYLPTDVLWSEIEKMGVVVANYDPIVSTRDLMLSFGKTGNAITIRDPEYADLPTKVKIYQNYPNPFNPETNITFDLPRPAFVKLDVYDITGRFVRTLTDRYYRLGSYSIPFSGEGLSSGVYLYRLKVDDQVFTKKMTLIK